MSAAAPGDRAVADARWSRHVATLDVRPDAPLHGPESTWTARDEYAHLARWMAVAGARVRAGRDRRPPPDLGSDPNLRWQAEDRSLTLDEARLRARHARDQLLAAVDSLPVGEVGDGLRALADGDLVAHLDQHFGFIVDGMLADEAAAWQALVDRLDGVSHERAASEDELVASPRAVFAHLARWFDFAERSLTAAGAGRPLPDVPDVDEANRAWTEADRAIARDEARRRAIAGRERVLALARAITVDRWTAQALNRLDGNTVGHYPEHMGDRGD